MSYEKLVATIRGSFYEALIIFAALTILFMALEASVGRAASETFTVTQNIADEVSFQVAPNDVTMTPNIPGSTGGQATGSTQFVINSNNATGYTVTIAFSSTTAMKRDGSFDVIANYTPAGTTSPTLDFDIGGAGTQGEFGYTVDASTTYHVATEFRTDGSICNVPGGSDGSDQCWQAPSTTANEIINATTSTPTSGATSSVRFVVEVPSSPSPQLPSGNYVATVTLTAATQ